jgi:hypothetical protein
MTVTDKKVVTVGPRLAKFIGSKATREKKLQAASMQAEFTLHDTLIILCYLGRDPDPEISSQARKNLIPAARNWYSRPDRPEIPEPIQDIVMKVIERVGRGEKEEKIQPDQEVVVGNIGLFGLGEIIQAIDHNNRNVRIVLQRNNETVRIFTEQGKVVGAISDHLDGMEALHRAFGWIDADFRYEHGAPDDFRNRIKVNTLTLVMDALEHAPDEDPYELEVSSSWRVQGHLRIMNVFEIAEIFEMNSKRAVCTLKRADGEGYLYFNEGRICNAVLNDMTGLDAACHLLAWPNASFIVRKGGDEVPDVIHVGMQNLIIEAMRLLDEGVTVSEKIASELALIDELFEGRDVVTLPVLDKVRLVFGEDETVRESLQTDSNPLVRKAIKVKISKTVHKYLSQTTEHEVRLRAAQGMVPLSTTEKLVLLSYLSHDESQEIRDAAKNTLENLDVPTYRKGFGADLHPSVMDFLVRETIRDETLIKVAASCDAIFEETAIYIIDNWHHREMLETILGNKRLLERSATVVGKILEYASDMPDIKKRIDSLEQAMIEGQIDMKVEGALSLCGLYGPLNAARQGGRSGTLVLSTDRNVGHIYFRRGRIIGAICGDRKGMPVLHEMAGWSDARFRYVLRTYLHTENLDPTAAEAWLESSQTRAVLPAEGEGFRMISGNLDCMDVYEALSMMEGTPIPVSLMLVCEEGSAEIVRDRSRILHVQISGKDDPYQAMAAVISWKGIRFIVRPVTGSFPVTVDKSLQDFFSEATRHLPEEFLSASRPGDLPEWELSEMETESLYHRIGQMGVADKVKLAFFGNKEARSILVRDPIRMVAMAVVKSPKIREDEIEAISKSRQVCEDVLRHIANTKEWVKSYSVKLNLVANSKTPVPIAMKLLPHLREPDLRKLAKSKNVPAAVASQARRLAEAKTQS